MNTKNSRTSPLPGLIKRSVLKNTPKPVHEEGLKLASRIYTKERVDKDLASRGLHTEGNLRNTVNTSPGSRDADMNNAMIDMNA